MRRRWMRPRPSPSPDCFADTFQSPVGKLYLIFSGSALSGIDFQSPPSDMPRRETRQSARFKAQLAAYFRGELMVFEQEVLFLEGTAFDHEVWHALKEVPYGETRTYRWIAERIGRPRAVRAAGQALGRNPIPIVIPCHRIIQTDGSLGGYTGGTDIKRRLLDLEYYARQATVR